MTLATIAERLGVSKSTVSNAYNRPDQLSAQLRARVQETARELGYPGPDPIAVTFSRRRANAIGLVFDDPVSYAFNDPAEVLFLGGVSTVVERAGLGLLLVPGGPDSELARHCVVDGFICHCDVIDDERLASLAERRLPMVVVDGPAFPGAPRVSVDDRGGARAAIRHLVELGHFRIGVIPTPLASDGFEGTVDARRLDAVRLKVTRDRLLGCQEAVRAAGTPEPVLEIEERTGSLPRRTGFRAATALLDRPVIDRPTAVFAFSDELAAGAMDAAYELGISVPGELSVVGFDDTPTAASMRPALTTVRQPHADKGRVAAGYLLAGGDDHVPERRLATELVIRASTAPASR